MEETKQPEVKFQTLRLQSCDPETATGTHSAEEGFSSPQASSFEFSLKWGRRRTLVTEPVWPRKLCNKVPLSKLHTCTAIHHNHINFSCFLFLEFNGNVLTGVCVAPSENYIWELVGRRRAKCAGEQQSLHWGYILLRSSRKPPAAQVTHCHKKLKLQRCVVGLTRQGHCPIDIKYRSKYMRYHSFSWQMMSSFEKSLKIFIDHNSPEMVYCYLFSSSTHS